MSTDSSLFRRTLNNESTTHVFTGAFLGLTWGSSLRAWMELLASQLGETPQTTWQGTFGGVLLPSAVVGALIGRSLFTAKTSEQKGWRWVILSPLLFILGPWVTQKNFISTLLKTGMGGGAVGVTIIGMFGGYALSGFGPKWTRQVAALLALLFLVAALSPLYLGSSSSAVPSKAHKVLTILLFVLLMIQLVVGISAPSRVR